LRVHGFVHIEFCEFSALEEVVDGDPEYAHSVFCASGEVDGRSFLEVFGGAGDFGDVEAGVNDLGEHFVVEDEIVAVGIEIDGVEYFAVEGAVSGVVFGEFVVDE